MDSPKTRSYPIHSYLQTLRSLTRLAIPGKYFDSLSLLRQKLTISYDSGGRWKFSSLGGGALSVFRAGENAVVLRYFADSGVTEAVGALRNFSSGGPQLETYVKL